MKDDEEKKSSNVSPSVRIIQAAKELFMEHGFKGTTTKMIAEAANVNESTLFRNFKSKDGIFIEITKQTIQNNNSKLESALEGDIPLENLLFQFGMELYNRIDDDKGLLLTAIIESNKRSELSKNVTNTLCSIINILERKLTVLYEKGKLQKNDFFAISMMYVEYLIGFFIVQNRLAEELIPVEVERLCTSASKVLAKGLLNQ